MTEQHIRQQAGGATRQAGAAPLGSGPAPVERLEADVAIIGGGIVGASAALFLRRAGLSVVVLERGLCGAAASGVNYGGVRTQGRAIAQLPLALRARALWAQLPDLIGTHGEYVQSGHLKLARSEADLHKLETYCREVREHGLDLHLQTGIAFRRAHPWLGDQAIAGSFCAEDGHANPRLVSPAFARAAQAAGARVIEHCEVTELARTGSGFVVGNGKGLSVQSRWLLNCAGAWALTVAERFGDTAPMTSIHPGMAVTEAVPRFMDVNVGVEGGGIYGRQTARGNCVMGGSRGAAKGSLYAVPTARSIGELCDRMATLFPALEHAHVIRFWSGVEGSLPDHHPVIGMSPTTPQLVHAFGFCGAGFQIGPAVGEALAELIHRGRTSVSLDAFSIDRFTSVSHPTPQGVH
jgi:sarcosine oxidase subunit beta